MPLASNHTADAAIELPRVPLPAGVRSRYIEQVNGLRMHILEAGFEVSGRPCILLLHGFPELAYSWRNVLAGLARRGYHVIAPDQRGFGRTSGWSTDYEASLRPFFMLNLVRDMLALLAALGIEQVAAVAGHDFGSPVAAWCALARPDMFRAVALLSAPFAGAPQVRPRPGEPEATEVMVGQLAALDPPKKHYQLDFCTLQAAMAMNAPVQGMPAFLRGYFHLKSADWPGNAPLPLRDGSADELARMPAYYIMDLDRNMPETVAMLYPVSAGDAPSLWLDTEDLAFYAAEFSRTGFQGGLNWYRCSFLPEQDRELSLFSGRRIEVPACFIHGALDWGAYQAPGALQRMQGEACADFRFIEVVERAGHWVQQEQPEAVVRGIVRLLSG